MSISTSDALITDIDECFHKEILTYVKYPSSENATRCFAYPQFKYESDVLTSVDRGAFPDDGCLPMYIAGSDAGKMNRQFGNVVLMTVNDAPDENRNYPESESSVYNGIINPHFNKGKSAIEFKALSKHPLSSKLIQVIEVEERNLSFAEPLKNPVHIYGSGVAPQTSLVLITQTDNGREKYYGPFECAVQENEIKLKASGSFDNSVAGFNESSFRFKVDLLDAGSELSARFVSVDEFKEKFNSSGELFDWISDDDLLNALGRVSRSMDEPLTKNQMRNLKGAISECKDAEAKIQLTDARRRRMLALLGTYEQWSSLPSEVQKGAIESADPQQLADYLLNDENFTMFYEKVSSVDDVCARLEQNRAKYRERCDTAKKDAEAAEAQKAQAQKELASYEESLDEKRQQLEREVAEKTEAAIRERTEIQDEIAQLEEKRETLQKDKIILEHQIKGVIEGMSDELSVSNKILESAMIKQIVTSLSGQVPEEEAGEGAPEAAFSVSVLIREDEVELDDKKLVDQLENLICELGGRDLTRNDIINLMICLNQGYVLTLAGLPGTGKTSLASILAGALGLDNSAAKRYTEVSVARGWTSYKDFVGYYNPLTGTMEKSNAAVFNAFAMLNDEIAAGLRPDEVAPYFVLLDEANLSLIEHYWAPFLKACDSFRNGLVSLSLGGESNLLLPTYLRFIATVNFDHTTEELSPRFLDRSWVITLDPDTFDFEDDDLTFTTPDYSEARAYSVSRLQQTFGTKKNASMKPALKAKMKEVLEICSEHHCPVSPRSQKMIWNYICTADILMDQSTAQTSFSPVDYAVSQKVLPLLAGTEEKVEKLLRDLAGVDKLPVTKSRLEHMLEVGNDSGYYQYFA